MFYLFLILLSTTYISISYAGATEHIISFHVDIDVNVDRTLTVHETISVYNLGNKIKHGIYRTLPKSYQITAIEQNGFPCSYFIKGVYKRSELKKICIGTKELLLSPGVHTYHIDYFTPPLIKSYYAHADNEYTHDLLYWSITGERWSLPIAKISVSIHFPENFNPNKQDLVFTTNTPSHRIIKINQNNIYSVSLDNSLLQGSEATFTALWKQGFLNKPSMDDTYAQFYSLALSYLSIFAALLLILLHCFRLLVRRNQFYERSYRQQKFLPHNFLPVEASYLAHGSLLTDGVTGTLIDMAQRHYFTIQKKCSEGFFSFSDTYVLAQQESNDQTFLYQEIAKELFKKQNSLLITKKSPELKKIIKIIQKHCTDKGYFEEESDFNGIIMIISFLIVVAAYFYLDLNLSLHPWPHSHFPYHTVLFFIAIACGIWSLFLGKILTPRGKSLYNQLDSFKLFLLSHTTHPQEDEPCDTKYLAYIVALYLNKELLCSRKEKLPQWYQDLTGYYNSSDLQSVVLAFHIALIPLLSLNPISGELRRKYGAGRFRSGGGGGGSSGGGGW